MSFGGVINSEDSDSDVGSIKYFTEISPPIRSRSPINFQIKSNMAVPPLKAEYLQMIPDFNGETELLPVFIETCEKLVNRFYNAADVNDFQNDYLMSSIRTKIKGEAAINISSSLITNWAGLKSAISTAHCDKRDAYSLGIELTELKQGSNETCFDFYNKIQHLLNLQISYAKMHSPAEEARILSEYFKNYALRVLLRGLRDPIGSSMRTKNPTDLNIALYMLTNDFQLETSQINKNKPNKLSGQNNYNTSKFLKPFVNYKPLVNTKLQQPTTFWQPPQPRFQTQFIPNNRSNSNVFKSNRPQKVQAPTPMSISTRNTFTRPPQRNFFRSDPNETRNFISEELYNIDDTENAESETPINFLTEENICENSINSDGNNLDYYVDGQNFLVQTASEQDSNC